VTEFFELGMCLSGAGVEVLAAGAGGEDSGDLSGHLEPERAGRREDSPVAVVARVAGPEATLTVSSDSDSVLRSCLLAAVSISLVMFRCEKSLKN